MPKFSNGTKVDSKGYLAITAGPHRGKRVHTLVAEAMLGRELKRDEQVHHQNGDKLDCSWRNLKVMGEREHGAVSAKQAHWAKTNDFNLKKDWDEYFDEANEPLPSPPPRCEFPIEI